MQLDRDLKAYQVHFRKTRQKDAPTRIVIVKAYSPEEAKAVFRRMLELQPSCIVKVKRNRL